MISKEERELTDVLRTIRVLMFFYVVEISHVITALYYLFMSDPTCLVFVGMYVITAACRRHLHNATQALKNNTNNNN